MRTARRDRCCDCESGRRRGPDDELQQHVGEAEPVLQHLHREELPLAAHVEGHHGAPDGCPPLPAGFLGSASARAADEGLLAQRLMVASEVARNYFLLRSLDAQVKVLHDTIALREEALKLQKSVTAMERAPLSV